MRCCRKWTASCGAVSSRWRRCASSATRPKAANGRPARLVVEPALLLGQNSVASGAARGVRPEPGRFALAHPYRDAQLLQVLLERLAPELRPTRLEEGM